MVFLWFSYGFPMVFMGFMNQTSLGLPSWISCHCGMMWRSCHGSQDIYIGIIGGWGFHLHTYIYIYGYGSIPTNTILMGWTSIYQLFWCSPGVQGFDTLPYIYILWLIISPWISREYPICVHNSSINLGKFDHDRTLSSRTLESWFILGKSSPNGQTLQVLVKYHNLPRYFSLLYHIMSLFIIFFRWPFQEPKLEVPTIYVRPIFQA